MPAYEVVLITRPLLKADLIPVVKRTGEYILKSGGVLRKIEGLGTRDLPFTFFVHNEAFTKGSYFLLHINASRSLVGEMVAQARQDVDLLKVRVNLKVLAPPMIQCTLEDELKPPAERASVTALLEGKKKKRLSLFQMKRAHIPDCPEI